MNDILSTDATKANTALATLLVGYLADIQSELLMSSPYTGTSEIDYTDIKYDASIWNFFEYYDLIEAARAEAVPDGVPGYEEIGNTAHLFE